ncbi:30S ribosomal protein S6 [Candidatus Microgenomates bacterium]|nr:30S ribosomal protein S6 [Candidatus Microgenomates bacterium]
MTSTYNFIFLTNQQEELNRLKELISSLEGSVNEEKQMGTKTLAYPINKIESADYYEWTLTMPVTRMTEFKKKLGFEDNLIRYLLLTKED